MHLSKTLILLTILLGSLNHSLIGAKTLSSASEKATADLTQSLDELAELRTDIAKTKVPLINNVAELEGEVRQKQNKVDRLLRLRDNNDMGLNRLRDQVKALKEQNDYAASLLDEFVRTFETRIDFSETQLYKESIQEARLILDDSDANQAERFQKQLDVISVALNRLDKLVGGYTYEGLALIPSGDIIEGKFSAYGPSVYFNSKDSSIQGIAVTRLNAAEAAIAFPGGNYEKGLINFIENGEGTIPIDITLGKALKIEEGNDTFFEHLAKGGSVGSVIIALGIACLIIGGYKAYVITGFKTPSSDSVQKVIQSIENGNTSEAKTVASGIEGAGGDLLITAIDNHSTKRANLEEILYEKILSAQPGLERFLPFMALTAAAAPLLGLLGTVTGMIKTFTLITIFGTGDAKSLSSGISEALVTTELGLVVAIPSLILHGLLSRMAKQKIGDLEQISVSFLNGITGIKKSDS
ncbi:MAG: MotA/TolQ/ExbB proton channel family protein [Opitutae bacterium]|nr:MotA/TolQ/ExbB proton channel family protein [Opitutae bacterium]